MSGADLARIYVVEITVLSLLLAPGGEKMRGEKMQVSLIMSLKTNGEKMSDFWLAIMLLKIRYILSLCHYITDNRWPNEGSGCRRIRSGVRGPESEVFGGWTRIPRFGFWQSRSGKEDSEFRAPVSRIPSPESSPDPTEALRLFRGCCILGLRCSEPTPTRLHTLVTGFGASLQAGRVALV